MKNMIKIALNCFGITIHHHKGDIGGASLVSNMHEDDTKENKLFNAGVDGLESIILAHFCAGVDISKPEYIEGIETAYMAIGNNL